MKIICIGRNYVEHIKELNNERPDEPVIFTKPDTALLKNGEPFYYPEVSKDIHHEVEILLRIGREGKNIEEQFALKYVDAIGLGIDFTARDLQKKAKEKGLPWALAKGFNGSAPISEFRPIEEFSDLTDLHFHLEVNGDVKQRGHTQLMIFSFEYIIAYISRYFTLKAGDIIFTGTPSGVGAVHVGDRLDAYLEEDKMLSFEIK
ncbi:2-keto-4-pentenoate hydratase/2-oxohepta-3-ene-1,7-dioic acid hydratase (catechol pathway) [Catalinimonas alkaloidigena]|uniref:2-keto-4-pentenoate hydratase/2-oxohepta-3-ene-1,7-dioic acid hydratase (Catechol pathway) n=1 Tax=Catalinimonas alkaloidigena TaxID=1075417 RepID=A0A1G9K5K3_9BACT|nr:fumarylacetoacetate hydrolase family protein [Catalinimonas alkaloidigena]SDL45028.1 2-keto-4-pentenoate hydratase/2-oxohepta-3-ene-1,7-dioic acid hydratase (catechol pathway) [Catalinimonas alkaloidigena]